MKTKSNILVVTLCRTYLMIMNYTFDFYDRTGVSKCFLLKKEGDTQIWTL